MKRESSGKIGKAGCFSRDLGLMKDCGVHVYSSAVALSFITTYFASSPSTSYEKRLNVIIQPFFYIYAGTVPCPSLYYACAFNSCKYAKSASFQSRS